MLTTAETRELGLAVVAYLQPEAAVSKKVPAKGREARVPGKKAVAKKPAGKKVAGRKLA